jgi:hypothetical protein
MSKTREELRAIATLVTLTKQRFEENDYRVIKDYAGLIVMAERTGDKAVSIDRSSGIYYIEDLTSGEA